MASIQIIGKLGKNVEIKQVGQNKVAEFSIAETVGSGQNKKTIWYNCSMWKGTNTQLMDYLNKGAEFLIIGELNAQNVGNNGTVYNNVLVHDLKFTGGSTNRNQAQQPQAQQQSSPQGNQQGYQQNGSYGQQQAPQGQRQPAQGLNQRANAPDLDDDLPF